MVLTRLERSVVGRASLPLGTSVLGCRARRAVSWRPVSRRRLPRPSRALLLIVAVGFILRLAWAIYAARQPPGTARPAAVPVPERRGRPWPRLQLSATVQRTWHRLRGDGVLPAGLPAPARRDRVDHGAHLRSRGVDRHRRDRQPRRRDCRDPARVRASPAASPTSGPAWSRPRSSRCGRISILHTAVSLSETVFIAFMLLSIWLVVRVPRDGPSMGQVSLPPARRWALPRSCARSRSR